MLKQLYIKNFTLIDELNMQFFPGFSVITGETGAGKSIILGALSLLLGQRADPKSIKAGCDRCVIEAHFDLSRYQMEPLFNENDLDYDAEDCIVRRELTAAGKSRGFINDTPVNLAVMKAIGQQLIDIHSQHQNLLLQEEDFQLNVVDIIAQDAKQVEEYQQAFNDYHTAHKAVSQMEEDIQKANENEEFLRFQYKELEDAHLEAGQQESLEQESETLSHVEDIKAALFTAENALSGDNNNIVEQLREVSRALDGIRDIYPDAAELAERVESSYIELKDIAGEVGSLSGKVDFDPSRLEEIDNQLSTIYSLQKKHRVNTVEELVALRDDIHRQLDGIDNSDEVLKALREKEEAALKTATQKAKTLTALRQKSAQAIEKEMQSRLSPLGIPNVRFAVNVEPAGILTAKGADKISFLFSANTSSPMQPVAQIASGGEIARVMLSLKAMISGTVKLPTIIFDEIDTGVSGRVAEMMAKMMQEMGQQERQVLSITHLPQIAALGTHHYKVFKEETSEGTKSRMRLLSEEDRVQEIAQMLSGSDITDAAIDNAKALLNK